MNQPYARVNQPYATLTLASALREMFGVQLYKNNARALLSRILSIFDLDWLQHARSVRGVYEKTILNGFRNFWLEDANTFKEEKRRSLGAHWAHTIRCPVSAKIRGCMPGCPLNMPL